ncbi:MAG: carboxypeptidase-like regulatory domain-containing protein, partial [Flavobacteriaceae bacterium]
MKYALCIIVLLGNLHWSMAQSSEPNISLTFTEKTRKEVLLQIETLTGYRTFFSEEWLPPGPISGSYTNSPLSTVFNDLFGDTSLNFYISEEGFIVLTRNTVIRDTLPPSFYKDSVLTQDTDLLPAPTVSNPYPVSEETTGTRVETVRIGKEQRGLSSQNFKLSGFVRNAETGTPIPNLALIVKESNKGTTTKADGSYEIELKAGAHILQTQAIGIESVEKRVIMFNDGRLDFNLSESVERLEEVVVESNRTQNVENVVTGVVEFEIAEIKNIPLVLGERDILKTAITLPGISSAGEGAAGYNVRGGSTDQNLILLDDA